MLSCQIYSTKPLPRYINLGSNPYTSGDARRVLADLGVFFYRDNKNTKAVVLDNTQIEREVYHSQLALDDETFEIDEWILPDTVKEETFIEPNSGKSYIESVNSASIPKPQDAYAWVIYNKSVTLSEITDSYVKIY